MSIFSTSNLLDGVRLLNLGVIAELLVHDKLDLLHTLLLLVLLVALLVLLILLLVLLVQQRLTPLRYHVGVRGRRERSGEIGSAERS
eukprot:9571375-Heterocapsa_arctica.AAC.1